MKPIAAQVVGFVVTRDVEEREDTHGYKYQATKSPKIELTLLIDGKYYKVRSTKKGYADLYKLCTASDPKR
jgi:hypothetical protein